MSSPAFQHIGDTGTTLFELSYIHVGGDDLSISLRRQRAGVRHERYGITTGSRTWKQAKVWTYNINGAPTSYIESLRAFFEAGSFYLYPDSSNTAVKYAVFWEDDTFDPKYLAPNLYSLQCNLKETTIGAGTPAFLTAGGNQTVGGNLSVGGTLSVVGSSIVGGNQTINGDLTVNGTFNLSDLEIDSVKSNGDIFINYNGPESTSRLWFYENGSPSGASIYWDEVSNGLVASKNLFVQGTNGNFGKGQTSYFMTFTDGDGWILYDKNSHGFTTNQPWMVQGNLSTAADLIALGGISGSSLFVDPSTGYRAVTVNDANMYFKPSTLYGSAWGVTWEDTGSTPVTQIGVYALANPRYTDYQYGYIGYGPTPSINTYMRWNTTGVTNEGRLTVNAPSFVISAGTSFTTNSPIEGTSWFRTSNDVLCRTAYINQASTTYGAIQFSSSTNSAIYPRLAWCGSTDGFHFNRPVYSDSHVAAYYDLVGRTAYLNRSMGSTGVLQFCGWTSADGYPKIVWSSATDSFNFNRQINNLHTSTITGTTSTGVSGISNEQRFSHAGAFQTDSSTSYGILSKYIYTAGTNSIWMGGHSSFDSDIKLVNSSSLIAQPNLYAFKSSIDAGGVVIGTSPIKFTMTNPATTQAWANGYLLVDVYGNSSSNMIAAVTNIRANGAGNGIGYQGAAIPSSSSHVGALIGVQGYAAFGPFNSRNSFVAALDGTIVGSSTGTSKSRIMGVRANGHALIYNGSIIAASGSSVESPNSLTGITGHLNFTGGSGELFVQGKAEFDNEVFFDSNESHSYTAVSSNHTAASRSIIIVDATAADRTVTLPAATTCAGRQYTIKKTSGTTYKATINGGGTNIDGSAAVDITTSYGFRTVISNGTEWFIVATG